GGWRVAGRRAAAVVGLPDRKAAEAPHWIAGVARGAPAAPPQPLPEKPYRSLLYYDRADRPLFAGRDADVRRFALLLDDPAARLLILHGESGVGKSSFLRAGVLPYVEDEHHGYQFLRDASSAKPEILVVRATSDLVGQLAVALHAYGRHTYTAETPTKEPLKIDLSPALDDVFGAGATTATVAAALRKQPDALARFLARLGELLPFTPVVVIDQMEEVFTLAVQEATDANQKDALRVLKELIGRRERYKVVLALRTEYYGRLVDRLRDRRRNLTGVREYLLTDFSREQLIEAIERPTLKTHIR